MTSADPTRRDAFRVRTRLVGAGRKPDEQFGFVNTPIYRGSTVLFPTYADLMARRARFSYGTQGTPTTAALEEAWSEFAGAATTVLTPSGLAAIGIALLTALKSGDHALVMDNVYRPTRHFCDTMLSRFGIDVTYFDPMATPEALRALIRPTSRVLFAEAPGSQSFEVADLTGLIALARAHEICTIIDNTWATPLFLPPHALGFDLAVEAGTKYLSGHSDLLLGLTSANAAWASRLRATFDAFAVLPGPDDVFLALRGLRTLHLRLHEAQRQARIIADWLAARPEVARLLHPAYSSCPGHANWERDFKGASGLFSIILKPVPTAALAAFLDGLELFGMGYSWGGYESLVIPFDCAAYRSATRWVPEGPGLRFSIGLEDTADLIDDLAAGFERLAAACAGSEPGRVSC
jgi:cystathionine beta-lyase